MRMALAALVLSAGAVVAPVPGPVPSAGAEPYDCPPACDTIPDSAWIAPQAVPLAAEYGWPPLAEVARAATAPRFRFEELCETPPVHLDPRGYAVVERAVVVEQAAGTGGRWQLQAQVLHWRGETWWAGQRAAEVFDTAVAALLACQRTNPGASPSLTAEEPGRIAAVVAGPVVLHQYLVVNPANSTISELALWSTAPPSTPWPPVADEAVLDALDAPLCVAYIGSCR